MEVLGYTVINAGIPPEAMIEDVLRSVRQPSNTAERPLLYSRGGKEECERFLQFSSEHTEARVRLSMKPR